MFKNKQFKRFGILLGFLLFFVGCASKNREVFSQYQIQTLQLKVSSVIVDNHKKFYDGKKFLFINSNLKSLSFLLKIDNPNKINYRVWSETIIKGKHNIIKRFSFYKEEGFSKLFKVNCPLNTGKKVLFVISLRNNKGQALFELLPLEYQVQQEETERGGY